MSHPLRALAAAFLALALAGCGFDGVYSLPLPGAAANNSDTYVVDVQLEDVLDLVPYAAVKVNGATVGHVRSIEVEDRHALVSCQLRNEVHLPANAVASVQQTSVLGEKFVEIEPPVEVAPTGRLHDGSVIPEPATSDAATIEAVLSRAALLVNGGAVRDLAKVVNGLGADLDGRGNRLADLISQTSTLVRTLSQRSDQIQAAIRDTGTLTDTIAAQQSTVNAAVAAAGPAVRAVSGDTQNIVDLAARLSRIAGELQKFPSVNGTGKRSLITDMNNLSAGLNAAAEQPGLDLNVLNASIGIVGGKVASSTGAGADADVTKIAVGAVPDPNFPGNPDARIPDGTDWANFVGSLAYTLQRLHDRVIGPGR